MRGGLEHPSDPKVEINNAEHTSENTHQDLVYEVHKIVEYIILRNGQDHATLSTLAHSTIACCEDEVSESSVGEVEEDSKSVDDELQGGGQHYTGRFTGGVMILLWVKFFRTIHPSLTLPKFVKGVHKVNKNRRDPSLKKALQPHVEFHTQKDETFFDELLEGSSLSLQESSGRSPLRLQLELLREYQELEVSYIQHLMDKCKGVTFKPETVREITYFDVNDYDKIYNDKQLVKISEMKSMYGVYNFGLAKVDEVDDNNKYTVFVQYNETYEGNFRGFLLHEVNSQIVVMRYITNMDGYFVDHPCLAIQNVFKVSGKNNSYGKVYHFEYSGQPYAVKILENKSQKGKQHTEKEKMCMKAAIDIKVTNIDNVTTEVEKAMIQLAQETTSALDAPPDTLVDYLPWFCPNNYEIILMSSFPRNEILDILSSQNIPKLDDGQLKDIVLALLSHCYWMNVKQQPYCDWKPENMIFHKSGSFKLIDFGGRDSFTPPYYYGELMSNHCNRMPINASSYGNELMDLGVLYNACVELESLLALNCDGTYMETFLDSFIASSKTSNPPESPSKLAFKALSYPKIMDRAGGSGSVSVASIGIGLALTAAASIAGGFV